MTQLTYEKRQAMKTVADKIANRLMLALKAGEIKSINIDVIRASCEGQDKDGLLSDMVTRRVVELAG